MAARAGREVLPRKDRAGGESDGVWRDSSACLIGVIHAVTGGEALHFDEELPDVMSGGGERGVQAGQRIVAVAVRVLLQFVLEKLPDEPTPRTFGFHRVSSDIACPLQAQHLTFLGEEIRFRIDGTL